MQEEALSLQEQIVEMEELERELGMKFAELVRLNGLSYCKLHMREICHSCKTDLQGVNEVAAFQLPNNGKPQYPQVPFTNKRDSECRDLLATRCLDIQRALYPKPKLGSVEISASMVVLPPVDGSDDVRYSPSPIAMQQTLLRLFRQAQGMASSQRFDFASMSQILLHDYDTFSEASHLYKEQLTDIHGRRIDLMASNGQDLSSSLGKLRVKMEKRRKAKASLLSVFSFFLDLKTQHSFWRTMELMAEAFAQHVEKYDQDADGERVLTEMAKTILLEWMGHVFWSLQQAQFQLKSLWFIQDEIYNRGTYPFYPYVREALEAGLDVYLIIVKLCNAELYNFGSVLDCLKELQKASKYADQMGFVNAGMMAAIDEFTTRLRVLQVLYSAAQLAVSKDEIKAALLAYPFDPEGEELHSKTLDVLSVMCNIRGPLPDDMLEMFAELDIPVHRPPPPPNPSFLQKLIIVENAFRRQYSAKMSSICPISNNFEAITKDMFDAFKSNFSILHRDHIRPQWKEYEHSLLPSHVLKRSQHRRAVGKEKRRQKDKSPVSKANEHEAWQERPYMDASLFWEVGDGSLEPYVPPTIREKLKTRKEGYGDGKGEEVAVSDEGLQTPDFSPQSTRLLDQLKSSDYETRDVLWGKRKGCLKWSCLLQLLTRIGCKILNLDGSKKKVVDVHTGRSTVLHRPHPGDTCRTDQQKLYCDHIKEHLKLRYQDLVCPGKEAEISGPRVTRQAS